VKKAGFALVKLLLDPPNLLLMDEPTTHLDMASIDALAYALDQFQGTLIFISHDVYFIRTLASHVVHVNAGQLTHYPGGYEYYLDKTKALSARAALTSAGQSVGSPHPVQSRRPPRPARRWIARNKSGLKPNNVRRVPAGASAATTGSSAGEGNSAARTSCAADGGNWKSRHLRKAGPGRRSESRAGARAGTADGIESPMGNRRRQLAEMN